MDLTGRLLLATLFALGAVQKLVDPAPVMALLASAHLPPTLIWPAAAFNAVGALALALDWQRTPVALALAAHGGVTRLSDLIPADPWRMSSVPRNRAIAGHRRVVDVRPRRRRGPRNARAGGPSVTQVSRT
jgi:putative oxidoreductase